MKEIKITSKGDFQMGIRIPSELHSQLIKLAQDHDTSIQKIIIYILEEEIKEYD